MNRLERLRIVLVRPRGPANVGGAARAVANAGIRELTLVDPREPPDHPDTVNWAAGAAATLSAARIVGSLEEALADTVLAVATTARPRHLAARADIREAAPRLLEVTASGPVAIVFGPEDHGLANAQLDLCQELAVIPTSPEHSSINLAGAVLLVTHELYRASLAVPTGEKIDLATHDERQRLVRRSREIINLIGYRSLGKSYGIDQTLGRLALRGSIERRDLRNILAVLRHIEWTMTGR